MVRVIIFCFLGFVSSQLYAQDAHFSQYFSNPIYLNPAFAGYNGGPTINTSYRMQDSQLSTRTQASNTSYDMLVGKRHGLAVSYLYENEGEIISGHSLTLVYAPTFRLFKKQLAISPAMGIAWKQRILHASNLTFADLINPRYNTGYQPYFSGPLPTEDRARNFLDFSMGLLLTFKGLVYGVNFDHLTQPDESFGSVGKLPLKITSHISYQFKVTEKFKLAPALIFINQQDFTEFLPSATFSVFGAKAGFAYRVNINNPDNAIFMFGYEAKGFKVGYSYDLTVASNPTSSGGSHEVSLAYVFNCKKSEYRKGVSLINF